MLVIAKRPNYNVIKFLINVFERQGVVPQVITTYNGVQFTSNMTKTFLELYDVYVKFVATMNQMVLNIKNIYIFY